MKVSHVISGLRVGGAERMLTKLLANFDHSWEAEVITLADTGEMAGEIESLGVPVRSLEMDPRLPNPVRVRRLVRWLDPDETDVVQTWMYHADLVGGVAAKLGRSVPVVWGIRQSSLDPDLYKRRTLLTARACALLSGSVPDRIVSNSHAAVDSHARIGYDRGKMQVVPNGFDLDTFRPDEDARESVRDELGVGVDAPLLGQVARFHPQKDHRTFVGAAGRLHESRPDVHYLLCGRGVDRENRQLLDWIREAGTADRTHLLGQRRDVPRLTAALDVATLASKDEGFPNVAGEAMACGVPCVVTDVGDSATLVGDTGAVVPPGDPNALAKAWLSILELGEAERHSLGFRARERIRDRYSISTIVGRYQRLYEEVVGSC